MSRSKTKQNYRQQRLRKMTFLNTHRIKDDKYNIENTLIETSKNYDHIVAITRGRLPPQHI